MANRSCDKLLRHAASCADCQEVHRLIVEEGADVDCTDVNGATPLILAAQRGHLKAVELLLYHHASVDAREHAAVGGAAPVTYAVTNNHLQVVEALCNAGCDLGVRDATNGFSLLHVAARLNRVAAGALLVAKGADVHARDTYGYNASYWAKEYGCAEFLAQVPGLPPPAEPSIDEKIALLKLKRSGGKPAGGGGGKKKKKGKKGKKKKGKKKK